MIEPTVAPEPGKNLRVLFIELCRLGDVVCALPAIRIFRGHYAEAEITVLTEPGYEGIVDAAGCGCKAISFVGENKLLSTLRTLSYLRKNSFDLVVSLSPAKRNSLVAFFSKAKIKSGYFTLFRKISGLDESIVKIFVKRSVKRAGQFKRNENIIKRALKPLVALGLDVRVLGKTLLLPKSVETDAIDFLTRVKKYRKTISVQVCSSSRFRDWPEENFIKLFNLLKNYDILVFGSEQERQRIDRVVNDSDCNIIPVIGYPIIQAAAMIARSDLFIGLDSGLMHIADSLCVPMVLIFGPSNPVVTGTINRTAAIISKNFECSPCRQDICARKIKCMRSINPEEVFKEVIKKINV